MTESGQPTKPRLLLVTTELRPGGAEKCLTEIAVGLAAERWPVTVASLKSAPPEHQSRLVGRLKTQQIPVHFLNCNSRWNTLAAVSRLKKLILQEKFDVVQSFLFHANVVAGLATSKTTRLFTGIRVADPSRLRHWMERRVTSQAEQIICVSRSISNFAVLQMKLPADRVVSIPNGIETNDPKFSESLPRFHPTSKGIRQPFVAFVGRLQKQKGLDRFLTHLVAHDAKLPPFDVVFCGDGPQRQLLETIARLLKKRTAHFLGWVPQPESVLRESVATILPSLWEGMPNVLLETMNLGRPFVAFAVDGVIELGEHERHQLAQPYDYPEFFARLTHLIEDPGFASAVGEKNRARIESHFSLKKMIADYKTAYLSGVKLAP